MKLNRWFKTFIIGMILTFILVCSFNYIIDPFGVFGDKVLKWYSYDMVNNPRIAKIAYLDQFHDRYDSYVIGGSKSSSISPKLLNEYYGDASFYSMMMYGGDFYDYEKTLYYLVENYNVKNIIIHMSMHEISHFNDRGSEINTELSAKVTGESLAKFYLRFLTLNLKHSFKKIEGLFRRKIDSFQYSEIIPETGVYNKVKRDAEDLGTLEEFLEKYPEFNWELPKVSGTAIDDNVAALKRMKDYCEERGISFMFIAAPTYYKEMEKYDIADIITYWKKIAEVTDFWDFTGYNSVSFDARNFYDSMHYRNSVGEMMLKRIFEGDSPDVPEDFGHYTTKDNVDEYLAKLYPEYKYVIDTLNGNNDPVKVPILVYHHLEENPDTQNQLIISPDRFKEHMAKLKEAGYESIFFKDLVAYVEGKRDLPEKPILITFDDGYLSNYLYAYPILKELNMKATISVIGWSVGETKYKGTDRDIIPHFTWEQGREMYRSGHIHIQNHSYDMHDIEIEGQPYRKGALQREDETFAEYVKNFKEDLTKNKELIESNIGNEVFVFAYPNGYYNVLTEKLVKDLGYKVTLTVDPGINEITRNKESLYKLKRINVTENITGEELLGMLGE